MAQIDKFSLLQKINSHIKNENRFKGLAIQAATNRVNSAAQKLLQEYDNHPVTEELKIPL